MRPARILSLLTLVVWAAPAHADPFDVQTLPVSTMTLTWAAGADWRDVVVAASTGQQAITVDGLITSFTVLPFLEILEGPPTPETLPSFQISFRASGIDAAVSYPAVTPFVPLTVSFPNEEGSRPNGLTKLGFLTSSVGGQEVHFATYRELFQNPASTIRFGFTITALDYTPTIAPVSVPEPSTLLLGLLGTLVLVRRRRAPANP